MISCFEALRGVLSVSDRIMVVVWPHTVSEALRGSQALSEALYVVPLYLETHSEKISFSLHYFSVSVSAMLIQARRIDKFLTTTIVLSQIEQRNAIPFCYGQVIVNAWNSGMIDVMQLVTMPCGDAP